jgi:hypothetical protein
MAKRPKPSSEPTPAADGLAVHPLALTYPPMSALEMDALTADIAARGLQRPIVRYEGQILDGRNRYEACRRAGVEPAFVEYEGDDPVGQVDSLNLSRDLTAAQRAFVAARRWMMNGDTTDRGKGRRGKGNELSLTTHSVNALAAKFRVGNKSILQARDLLTEAPDLAADVENPDNALSLAEAIKALESRREEAARRAQDSQRAATLAPDVREAIKDGRLSLEDAIAEAIRRADGEDGKIPLFHARQSPSGDRPGSPAVQNRPGRVLDPPAILGTPTRRDAFTGVLGPFPGLSVALAGLGGLCRGGSRKNSRPRSL